MSESTSSNAAVFVSYASADIDLAHAVRIHLEAGGIPCWMAPDDIVGATGWAGQIAAAIAGCRAMVVLVSRSSIASTHVAREAELAVGKGRQLIPVRSEDVAPEGPLEYLLAQAQWIDIFPGPLEANIEALRSRLTTLLASAPAPTTPAAPARARPQPRAPARAPKLVRPRSGARVLARLLVVLMAIGIAIFSAMSFLRAETGLPPAPMQLQSFSVQPNPAPPGAKVTATGREWATDSAVEIQWGAAFGTVVGSGSSDRAGNFSIPFAVPARIGPGVYDVFACQYAGSSCYPGNEFQVIKSTSITIAEPDTAPVANPDSFSIAMDESLLIRDAELIANDYDPDGDPMCGAIQLASGPGRGNLARVNDSTWLYVPWSGVLGADSFAYRVCDAAHGAWSNQTTVTIEMRFVGTVALSPTSGRPGTSVTVTGARFPVDAPVDVFWEQSPVAGTNTGGANGFSASFVVGDHPAGSYTVRGCVGSTAYCGGATFTITAPPPPPPAVTTTTTTRPAATTTTTTKPPTTTTTTTTKPPAVTTTTSSTTQPPATTGTPPPDPTTSSTAPDDGTAPANQPPIAMPDETATGPGSPVVIRVTANDADPDGNLDPGTLRIVAAPGHGTVAVDAAGGAVTYEPVPGFTGRDEFTYEVCDDAGACASAVVAVYVEESRCDVDAMRVVDSSLTPADGPPGSSARLTVDIERACPGSVLMILWDGSAWSGPYEVGGGGIDVELRIPNEASGGTHTIDVVRQGATAILARHEYTVPATAPAAATEEQGGNRWWWIPLAAAAVGAGVIAERTGRLGLRSRRRLAARLNTKASRLIADLDECEAANAGKLGIIPDVFRSREKAGGTGDYLLAYENPHAPAQEDGHRGWYYPRRKEPIRGVVVHTSEGVGLPGESADRTARYFATCRAPTSAHAVIDGSGVITLLPDQYTALHVPAANSASLGLVVCLLPDPEQQRHALAHAARWIRVKAAEYGFDLAHIDADLWRIGATGVLGHDDLEAEAPDPVLPDAAGEFPWEAILDPDAGPATTPSALPFHTGSSIDPCATVRKKASKATTSATRAAERAGIPAAGAPPV